MCGAAVYIYFFILVFSVGHHHAIAFWLSFTTHINYFNIFLIIALSTQVSLFSLIEILLISILDEHPLFSLLSWQNIKLIIFYWFPYLSLVLINFRVLFPYFFFPYFFRAGPINTVIFNFYGFRSKQKSLSHYDRNYGNNFRYKYIKNKKIRKSLHIDYFFEYPFILLFNLFFILVN